MTHPTDDSLKPCPFCGGAAKVSVMRDESIWSHEIVPYTKVECGDCGIGTDYLCEGWEPTAQEAWNTRALLAEQAQEPKAEDAELLDWLEEKHYALHPIKEAAGDDQYTLWWQVTDKRKSISGHPLGNIRAAIRAARAAERKA